MKRVLRAGPYAIPALAAVVAACSSGGGAGTHAVSPQSLNRAKVSLSFRVPEAAPASKARHASEIPAGTASLAVTVIGAGTSASATENVDAATCPPVNGAYVCSLSIDAPIGSDSFFADAFSGANETGTLLASASATYTIVANEANTVGLTLVPVATPTPSPSPSPSPSSMAFASVGLSLGTPALAAGTAKTVPITVTALAANGSPVVGAYAFPITVSDTDTSGATVIQVNGTASSTVTASSQSVTLAYTGLAIVPFTISVSASNATGAPLPASSPAVVYPSLSYPVITPVDGSGYIEIPSGGSATVTVTEPGWLGAPYNKSISLSFGSGACSYATLTPPAAGSGTFTLSSSYPGCYVNYCGIQFSGGPVSSNFTAELLPPGASPAPSPSPSPFPTP